MALRLRQSWQQLVHHRSQKIGQGGEPELGLRLNRVRGQYHGRRGPRPLGRRQQHRRLADARFPRKDESSRAVLQLRQQRGHVPELPIPPDQIPRPRHRCYTVGHQGNDDIPPEAVAGAADHKPRAAGQGTDAASDIGQFLPIERCLARGLHYFQASQLVAVTSQSRQAMATESRHRTASLCVVPAATAMRQKPSRSTA